MRTLGGSVTLADALSRLGDVVDAISRRAEPIRVFGAGDGSRFVALSASKACRISASSTNACARQAPQDRACHGQVMRIGRMA